MLLSSLFFSCEKNNEENLPNAKGRVEFSFNELTDNLDKKAKSGSIEDAASIIVSIKNESGEMVYDHKVLPLTKFNGNFITEPIDLLTGNYELTQFIVTDAQGNTIYISPIEGSEKDYLVDNPLPNSFSVNKDEVVKVVPEVVKADNGTPEDFGYTTFSFDVVETFNFLISVFIYDTGVENYQLTTATLNVTSEGINLYTDSLKAKTNEVTVNDGYDQYIVKVNKSGYNQYIDTLTNQELKAHYSSDDEGPLIVVLDEGNGTQNYQLSLVALPEQGGNVNGAGSYESEEKVDIQAEPASDEYVFLTWTGDTDYIDDASSENATVTMPSENITLKANFEQVIPKYTLSLNANPGSGGSVNGGGNYPADTSIHISASPDNGYTFKGWSGNVEYINNQNSSSTTVQMPGKDISLTANFEQQSTDYKVNLSANPNEAGSVSGDGNYQKGESVTISARPEVDNEFDGWTGDTQYLDNPSSFRQTFTMPSNNVSLTANFTESNSNEKTIKVLVSLAPNDDADNIDGTYKIKNVNTGEIVYESDVVSGNSDFQSYKFTETIHQTYRVIFYDLNVEKNNMDFMTEKEWKFGEQSGFQNGQRTSEFTVSKSKYVEIRLSDGEQ